MKKNTIIGLFCLILLAASVFAASSPSLLKTTGTTISKTTTPTTTTKSVAEVSKPAPVIYPTVAESDPDSTTEDTSSEEEPEEENELVLESLYEVRTNEIEPDSEEEEEEDDSDVDKPVEKAVHDSFFDIQYDVDITEPSEEENEDEEPTREESTVRDPVYVEPEVEPVDMTAPEQDEEEVRMEAVRPDPDRVVDSTSDLDVSITAEDISAIAEAQVFLGDLPIGDITRISLDSVVIDGVRGYTMNLLFNYGAQVIIDPAASTFRAAPLKYAMLVFDSMLEASSWYELILQEKRDGEGYLVFTNHECGMADEEELYCIVYLRSTDIEDRFSIVSGGWRAIVIEDDDDDYYGWSGWGYPPGVPGVPNIPGLPGSGVPPDTEFVDLGGIPPGHVFPSPGTPGYGEETPAPEHADCSFPWIHCWWDDDEE